MAEKDPIIRFGIMGCATIAIKVSRAIGLAPNSTVVAVASRSVDKARNFIAAHGLPEGTRAYGSYEEILEDEGVDAVYMPLPTSLHLQWAVATAEKGKHLLLDKPVALCVADLNRILEACERNGVQYMDATMWMHPPEDGQDEELLSDPARFGALRSVSGPYY
ncbi:putative D-xylose 1-dehydrogenase (NADP(+), D-xylono-1,5-lactone-forming) [Dioscorea sansibarensis]